MLLRLALLSRPFTARRIRRSFAAQIVLGGPVQSRPSAKKMYNVSSNLIGTISDPQTPNTAGRTFRKKDFSQTLMLKALRVQPKQCHALMKTFAG